MTIEPFTDGVLGLQLILWLFLERYIVWTNNIQISCDLCVGEFSRALKILLLQCLFFIHFIYKINTYPLNFAGAVSQREGLMMVSEGQLEIGRNRRCWESVFPESVFPVFSCLSCTFLRVQFREGKESEQIERKELNLQMGCWKVGGSAWSSLIHGGSAGDSTWQQWGSASMGLDLDFSVPGCPNICTHTLPWWEFL